ncbi:sarcosine oxidase subunit delta [Cupriavidus necator]|uniref:sarcosine oxidase subunit delta n=1 Tax=Cupriavidus necator TaxID=106590 RepID=UPI00339D4EC9
MLLIECPWCGPRAESEFSCGGEADIARPLETEKLSDREWGDYLFMRTNTRGTHREQWIHAQGCRRWFKVERDTVTYDIKGYETFGQPGASVPHQAAQEAPQEAPQVRGKK